MTSSLLDASDPSEYLGSDDVIQATAPEVVALAAQLRAGHPEDLAFARAAFEFVRDEITHSWDDRDRRVTLTATDVLREGTGLCFAKSHLLTAILRAQGIPAGLCYQRLRDRDGHVLHGLVAVHLDGGWHRLDARGNKPGVNAEFAPGTERLAFDVDAALGEVDYPRVYARPAEVVLAALSGAEDSLSLYEGGLPDRLWPFVPADGGCQGPGGVPGGVVLVDGCCQAETGTDNHHDLAGEVR